MIFKKWNKNRLQLYGNSNIKNSKIIFIIIGVYFLFLLTIAFMSTFSFKIMFFLLIAIIPVIYGYVIYGLKFAIFLNTILGIIFLLYEGIIYDFNLPSQVIISLIVGITNPFIILYLINCSSSQNKKTQLELKESMNQLAASYRSLEISQTKLVALISITKELLLLQNKDELITRLISLLNKRMFYDNIAYFDYRNYKFYYKMSLGFVNIKKEILTDWLNKYAENIKSVQIIPFGDPVLNQFNSEDLFDKGRLMLVPIYMKDSLKGIIIFLVKTDWVQEEDIDLMTILAAQLGLLLNKVELFEDTHQMAITDGGTNLYNQRYFYKMLKKMFNQAVKNNKPLSVIIFDIDDFKLLNDQYGHLFGDKVLEKLACLLKSNIRKNDILARYGGEEFSLILPFTGQKLAYQIAERMRESVEKYDFINFNGKVVKTSISGGVATYPNCWIKDPIELVKKADKALYRSKVRGKNKVYCNE